MEQIERDYYKSQQCPQPEGEPVEGHDPVFEGCGGRAWKLDLAAAMKRKDINLSAATLAAWVIEAPWAHPILRNYMVVLIDIKSAISIAEQTGKAPPKICLEGATHEIACVSLHPDVQPVIDNLTPHLHPYNYVGQFIETDDLAMVRARRAVDDITQGNLNPDSDGVRQWILRFGDANFQKQEVGNHAIVRLEADGVTSSPRLVELVSQLVGDAAEAGEMVNRSDINIPDDAAVTPGCGCVHCEIIREVRRLQGRPVLQHDGMPEAGTERVVH